MISASICGSKPGTVLIDPDGVVYSISDEPRSKLNHGGNRFLRRARMRNPSRDCLGKQERGMSRLDSFLVVRDRWNRPTNRVHIANVKLCKRSAMSDWFDLDGN